MSDQNDIKDLAQGLVNAEPLMVIGNTLASAGQKVSDFADRVVDTVRPMLPGQTMPTPKRTADINLPNQHHRKGRK